jgi:hypothetical protein
MEMGDKLKIRNVRTMYLKDLSGKLLGIALDMELPEQGAVVRG